MPDRFGEVQDVFTSTCGACAGVCRTGHGRPTGSAKYRMFSRKGAGVCRTGHGCPTGSANYRMFSSKGDTGILSILPFSDKFTGNYENRSIL